MPPSAFCHRTLPRLERPGRMTRLRHAGLPKCHSEPFGGQHRQTPQFALRCELHGMGFIRRSILK